MNPATPTVSVRASENPAALLSPAVLWRYREMMFLFTARDLKLRYRQTALGVTWTVLQPLMASGIFTIFLGMLAKVPSDGVPYAVFCFSGILLWNYFSNSLVRASYSVVGNQSIIGKIYFPRFLFPVSALLPCLVDLAIGMCALVPLLLYFHVVPSLDVLWVLPSCILLTVLFALGVGLWMSALNVRYRDVGNVLPFVMQLWMFATPVLYPGSLFTGKVAWVLYANPMAGIVLAFRGALLGVEWDRMALLAAAFVTAVVLCAGALFFRRAEVSFTDDL